MTLGEKILKLRKARGWSQEELAGHIGVTRQALSRWEADAAVPDTVNVVQMADLFGVSTDYLLRDGWTERSTGVPQETKAKEQRILAWVITALGAAGTLVTLIVGGVLHPNESSWDPTWEWFLVWSTRDILWLPILFWVTLLIGIGLLKGWSISKYIEETRRDLGMDTDETK